MNKAHRVIIGPGLGGRVENLRFLTRNWEAKYNVIPEVIPIVWNDTGHFDTKLTQIIDTIDSFAKKDETVSLLGSSASGSAMLNAFMERKQKIHKVVNLCGFLRPGNARWFRNFDVRSASSIAFRESVLRFVALEKTLTDTDRKKILTVRPLFGDELVPPDTVIIQGASNTTVPIGEHMLSIALGLIRYHPVMEFLKTK